MATNGCELKEMVNGWDGRRDNILKDVGFYKASCRLLTFAVDVFGRGLFAPRSLLIPKRQSDEMLHISSKYPWTAKG